MRSAFMAVGLVMAWSVAAWVGSAEMAYAIDVKLTMEEAKKALEAGRVPMEKAAEAAKPDEEIKKLMKQVSLTTRGMLLTKLARSEGGTPIPSGSFVEVTRVAGETVFVRKG